MEVLTRGVLKKDWSRDRQGEQASPSQAKGGRLASSSSSSEDITARTFSDVIIDPVPGQGRRSAPEVSGGDTLVVVHVAGAVMSRGLYYPAKLLNHWSAFGDICQMFVALMAPNSILIEKKLPYILELVQFA